MALQSIQDFDFGVGEDIMATNRVGDGPGDVSNVEIEFIVWLMFEQEFCKAKSCQIPIADKLGGGRTQHDGLAIEDVDEDDGDDDDLDDVAQYNRAVDEIFVKSRIARKYAEKTLQRYLGDFDILERLEEKDRHSLLVQLGRGTGFLRGQPIRTVPDVFHALRCQSKFQSKFNVISRLGRGQFGEVFKVEKTEKTPVGVPKPSFAVKHIFVSFDTIEEDVKMALNESKILTILNGKGGHKNIIRLFDYWLEIEGGQHEFDGILKFYIQLEYCHQSLDDWKSHNAKKGVVPEVAHVANIAFQLFDGLAFIHAHNILHLDINPKNILWIDLNYSQLKIVDFGLAAQGSTFTHQTGTPGYAAPEDQPTTKSDVYSASLTIIDVGKSIKTFQEFSRITKNKQEFRIGDLLLDELLQTCLDEDPLVRPTALMIKERLSGC